MKPIEQMNIAELSDKLCDLHEGDTVGRLRIATRMDKLHDLTRWIPVSERMPTEEDGKYIHVFDGFGLPFTIMRKSWDNYEPTHWQRITRPTL
jgi:hypothetical protein